MNVIDKDRQKIRGRRGDGRLKVCLAASGGGHVRQLLDIEPVWCRHDYFFVTEHTALGESIASSHPSRFVSHYALGQARLGAPFRMIRGALRNLGQSIRIVAGERPDVVITTGAGAVFFTTLVARLSGARIIMIESFARFDKPSMFGRLAGRIATRKIVQAAPLKQYWKDADLFDPLKILEGDAPPKKPLLFATVGATLPFDRMIDAVINLKREGALADSVIAQVGEGHRPQEAVEGVEFAETLDFDRVQHILREADVVVCHGGTGSLITALRAGCRVVAMPRRFDLGEHYDRHQEEITTVFAQRGLIEVARDSADLGPAIARARGKRPVLATTDPVALIRYLDALLARWNKEIHPAPPAAPVAETSA